MVEEGHTDSSNGTSGGHEGISVASWKFSEFEVFITILGFLTILVVVKMIYHRLRWFAAHVPESVVLILLGFGFGALVRFEVIGSPNTNSMYDLTPQLFFNYLLPPIVLEAAYSLYNRTFSEYLGLVMIFAVLGTIFNFLIIGFAMFGLYKARAFGTPPFEMGLKGFLLFSSLIVAVDPVAVLAIFQEVGVERGLYYVVFGESLLNDAVTVVLYEIMNVFAGMADISGQQIVLGIVSFFTVSFGGALIGAVFGVITCLLTRFPSSLEGFTVLLMAYFAYILTNTIAWSGIIAMITCGLIQAAYAFHNLEEESIIFVHKFVKITSEVSEAVIFLFLGIKIITHQLEWRTGFCLWGLIWCILARAIVVIIMSAVINKIRIDNTNISYTHQIVLIYGGLRGAVAFSLAVMINPSNFDVEGEYHQRVIITATLFIILFTVGFMGLTIKPLVKILKIRLAKSKPISLIGALNDSVLDETLACVELIVGTKGRNVVRDFMKRIDEKYVRRILQRHPEKYDLKLYTIYEKVLLKLHYASVEPSKLLTHLEGLPDSLKYDYLSKRTHFPVATDPISSTAPGNMITDSTQEWVRNAPNEHSNPELCTDDAAATTTNSRPGPIGFQNLSYVDEEQSDQGVQRRHTTRDSRSDQDISERHSRNK